MKTLFAALLLLTQSAFAQVSIEGIWGNPGGTFTFFHDGRAHVAWLKTRQYVTGTWRLDGAALSIVTDGGVTMAFTVLIEGDRLELADDQGVYIFKHQH